jgi:flagellar hook-associated protein 1 FlgK
MYSLYTMGNVEINVTFADSQGYTKLAVGDTSQIHDKKVLERLVTKWQEGFVGVNDEHKLNVNEYYKKITTEMGIENADSKTMVESGQILDAQLDSNRQAIMGVSLDEEMRNMITFQHAYNSSARVLQVVDSMIDRIINNTGRVGL